MFQKGQTSPLKGKAMSEETKEKLRLAHTGMKKGGHPRSEFKKGMTPWNKGKKMSLETKEKVRQANLGKKQSLETRQKRASKLKGELNHNYIDGRTKLGSRHTQDLDLKLWRTAVFTRDDYTCQGCGVRGGYLEAHHIKSWKNYPELRYAIDNGQTLCKPCHKLTDNYAGRKSNN